MNESQVHRIKASKVKRQVKFGESIGIKGKYKN